MQKPPEQTTTDVDAATGCADDQSGLARLQRLRVGIADEVQQQEKLVAALRAQLAGIDEAITVCQEVYAMKLIEQKH